jgi:cellulose 1,4-beta-cellobiosidase
LRSSPATRRPWARCSKNNQSGALPDAPLSGKWFAAQFQELMKNAYPPL